MTVDWNALKSFTADVESVGMSMSASEFNRLRDRADSFEEETKSLALENLALYLPDDNEE